MKGERVPSTFIVRVTILSGSIINRIDRRGSSALVPRPSGVPLVRSGPLCPPPQWDGHGPRTYGRARLGPLTGAAQRGAAVRVLYDARNFTPNAASNLCCRTLTRRAISGRKGSSLGRTAAQEGADGARRSALPWLKWAGCRRQGQLYRTLN